MPHYIQDPVNPGNRIDVIDLLKRNPDTPPPPEGVLALMRRDKWTRQEALLILAGYDPSNHVDKAGHPIGAIGAGVVYLDGTTDAMLSAAGLQHPLSLVRPSLFSNYLTLTGYARGEAMDERKPPQEWLAWAESKGFTPYWLGYWREGGSARPNVAQGETAICGQELLDFYAALEEQWNGEPIDYERWTVKSAMLDAGQAVRLMAGLDPERFPNLAYTKDGKAGEAKGHALRLEQLAAAANPPKERDTPAGWLAWADSISERVHPPFRAAVERLQRERMAASKATLREATTKVADWREAARQIADELFERDTQNGSRDSLKGYSRRVMYEMQKREIHGPRGRIDNSGNIQREALQADKWWAHKDK